MKDLLEQLVQLNISVVVNGDELDIYDPGNKLTNELLGSLSENKSGLLELLKDVNTTYRYTDIPNTATKEWYTLSSAQKRLYFLYEFDKDSVAYNLPQVLKITGDLDRDRLRKSLRQLLDRHESLRTSFELIDGEPVQKINERVELEIDFLETTEEAAPALVEAYLRPFTLSRAPLWRVGLARMAHHEHLLIMDMHHIITDGISEGVLIHDFMSLYNEQPLPALRLQYKDYAEWQQSEVQQAEIARHKKYWEESFSGLTSLPELPADFPRPAVKNHQGGLLTFSLDRQDSLALRAIAEAEGATLFMMLLSIYNVLMSKLTNHEDIVIGTPIAGRNHADLQHIVGMFVNTLPLRNHPCGAMTYREFLSAVKASTLTSFEHQDYPYEELIDTLQVERHTNRNPLFDAVFSFQNFAESLIALPGLDIGTYESKHPIAKFDITLFAEEAPDQFFFKLEYSTELFKESTIEKFAHYFKQIAAAIAADSDIRLADIGILSDTERQSLLSVLDSRAVPYPTQSTIVSLFERRAALHGHQIAVEYEGEVLTYRQLNERSNQLAWQLKEAGVGRDTIVGLLTGRSLATIIGMLGILKAGGAYLPIDTDYPPERIRYMINDSGLEILVVNASYAGSDALADHIKAIFLDANAPVIDAVANPEPVNEPTDACYIIYTSGTTGNPKGAIIEHRNVVRLLFNDAFQFQFSDADTWTMFHSHCFDFSVWEIYGALLYGGKVIIIPKAIAQDPVQYRTLLAEKQVTVLNQTPSAFYNLIQADQEAGESLGNLRYVIFGGEALKPVKLRSWKDKYPGTQLINMFGITETTVHVTYKEIGDYEIDHNISNIGKPIPTLSVYVLDKYLKPVPQGGEGELFVGGSGVGRGYLKRPELTAARFIDDPYKAGERLYRSGDRARLLPNGELEYLGRIDEQVKIRGFRIEPGEIETQVIRQLGVDNAIVIPLKDSEGNYFLCAYLVSRKPLQLGTVRSELARVLPDYMLPAAFVSIDEIPLTSNGKIDKSRLPIPDPDMEQDAIAPVTAAEKVLVQVWAEVLKIKEPGIDSNFFSLGGDSMKAIRLVNAINKTLQVKIRIADLFTNPTVRGLAACMQASAADAADPAWQVVQAIRKNMEQEKHDFLASGAIADVHLVEDVYPASDIQSGMIFHYTREQGIYHDQMVHLFSSSRMDTTLLDQALALLVNKHSILRTAFHEWNDSLLQVVYRSVPLPVAHYDLTGTRKDEQAAIIRQRLAEDKAAPFLLQSPGLWRFMTFALGGGTYCICFICHHAIIDGWSDASFNTELHNTFLSLLDNPGYLPAPLKCTYKDFVIDQLAAAATPGLADFWKRELAGYKRFEFGSGESFHQFNNQVERLPHALQVQLVERAREWNLSMRHVCFAAFVYALHLFSYDDDLTVGLITNNRPDIEDADKMLGCFLNTVPVRMTLPRDITWKEYVQLVYNKLTDLRKYDRLSFARIVDLLQEPAGGQNPITDIIFNYTDFHVYDDLTRQATGDSSGEEDNALLPGGNVQDNYLFSFEVDETGHELIYSVFYATSFVREQHARSLLTCFRKILQLIAGHATEMVSKQQVWDAGELHRALYAWNNTARPFPQDKTLIHLWEEQVLKTPHGTALIMEETSLTYAALNEQANQVAAWLHSKGVQRGTIVALMVDRSIRMIAAIIAIMKTGAAYLPLDNAGQESRVRTILTDSRAAFLLTEGEHLQTYRGQVDTLDIHGAEITAASKEGVNIELSSSDIAYIIYTSGSTGIPKGVVVQHRSVVNCIYARQEVFEIDASDRILQFSTISFDASVEQIWLAFGNGAGLVLIAKELLLDNRLFNDYITRHRVTHLDTTPSFLENMELPTGSSLRRIIAGGEACHPQLAARLCHDWQLYNEYGPTEATIVSMACLVQPAWTQGSSIPIGKPIGNTTAYILDSQGDFLPAGIAGELYIGGKGLAAGYLNDPVLTDQKFVDHPLLPGEKIYRTGDLARWLPDGNMEYLGRIDAQIKIRGFRVEPGEIENRLTAWPGIQTTVVQLAGTGVHQQLVAWYVGEQAYEEGELKQYLLQHLPDYMVPAHFVRLAALPLTANGKIDRAQLPVPELHRKATYTAPANEIETVLTTLWAEVLKQDVAAISTDSNFFEMGGHSLRATALVNKIYKQWSVSIPLREFFARPTIKELALVIAGFSGTNGASITLAPVSGQYFPLSSAQRRLYFLYEFDRQSLAYNMPQVLKLEGALDKERLQRAFLQLIARHESLRTSFEVTGDGPVQRVHEAVQLSIMFNEASPGEVPALIQSFVRPFQLDEAPLIRVGLLQLSAQESLLLVDMHHIITDGLSHDLLIRDFGSLYRGETLAPLQFQYKDYVAWQQSSQVQSAIARQKAWWLEEFANLPEALQLPLDHSRPYVQSHEGAYIQFDIDPNDTRRLKQLADSQGCTMYMVIFSAFNILLSKLSNQEDIVIGTPVAGRNHADLENIVGMFVNTLALRNYPRGEMAYQDFLAEVKARTLAGFDHQDFPYEELVESLQVARDLGRNPLFDVMFAYQEFPEDDTDMPGLSIHTYDESEKSADAKFDLTLSATRHEEQIYCSITYCTALFNEATIERFIAYFGRILTAITSQAGIRLCDIDILDEQEKGSLLETFNQFEANYPRNKTLVELFDQQAYKWPGNTAVVMGNKGLTYKQLHERSNRMAHYLRSKGAGYRSVVALLVDRSIEMVTAILAILKAGATYLPIDISQPAQRVAQILANSKADFLLTEGPYKKTYGRQLVTIGVHDRMMNGHKGHQPVSPLQSDDIAYIIYTSGSTGTPKGVMVAHCNMVNLVYAQKKAFGITPSDKVLQFSSIGFDASMEQVWLALLNGAALVLVSRDVILDKQLFQQYLVAMRVTHLHATPSFLETLELSAPNYLRRVVAGGEVCKPELVKQFGSQYRFFNKYGPTETTVTATMWAADGSESKASIPIGKPIANTRVYILGRHRELLPVGVAGEMYIGGDGVSAGYWQDELLTREKFVPHPLLPGELLYRTGDLARWLPDGQLEYLGRIDEQTKIRGFRIEPGEIESRLMEHPAVDKAVVMAVGDGQGRRLVAWYVSDDKIDTQALREHLIARLPDYMVPAQYVHLHEMPITPSGKVNRKALPAPAEDNEHHYSAPADATEKALAGIWGAVLKLDAATISRDAGFFELGGHSLRATVLVSQVVKQLGVQVPLREVFRHQTLKALSAYIRQAQHAVYSAVQPAPVRPHYVLSAAQQRLYFLYAFDNTAVTYNMPQALLLAADTDSDRLLQAFRQLIARHEALRTSFELVGEVPMQKIHPAVDFTITHLDLAGRTTAALMHDFIRPFVLGQAPLLRVGLARMTTGQCLLLIDMHHIITDGASRTLLVNDFLSLYHRKELPPLHLQYKDFAEWQQSAERQSVIARQKAFWLQQFAILPEEAALPVDHLRPAIQRHEGDIVGFTLSKEDSALLRSLAAGEEATLFMILLSACNILLSKLCNQEDIVVGTPVAGRNHADLQHIVGMFVNTLPMRNHPHGALAYREFLARVKDNTLACFENQDFPYEELVGILQLERNPGRNPLFDVVFSYQNFEQEVDSSGDRSLDVVAEEESPVVAKFDLALSASDREGQVHCTFEYAAHLFERSSVERFAACFKQIIATVCHNPDVLLGDIEIVSLPERQSLLQALDNRVVHYPTQSTIVSLFEQQVALHGHQIAVEYEGEVLTYRQLNERSNQLAWQLKEAGVGRDTIVGLLTDRSRTTIIGMLGILKAGGAYLPIDTDYPPERIRYMISDSGLEILVVNARCAGKAVGVNHASSNGSELVALVEELAITSVSGGNGRGIQTILLDADELVTYSAENPEPVNESSDACYIIYTSGTTGHPKGAIIEHRNVVRLLFNDAFQFQLSHADTWTMFHSHCFDFSVWEMYGALLYGGRLIIIPKTIAQDPVRYRALLAEKRVTVLNQTPSAFYNLIQADQEVTVSLSHLRYVIFGGEVLQPARLRSWKDKYPGTQLVNMYGITETTVHVTYKEIGDHEIDHNISNIGKPIPTLSVYILDKYLKPVLPGVEGELFVGGSGVGRGYLKRPELTAARFIDDPYKAGERLYRSGDRARLLPNGELEYLGRIDEQVKIRGFRIEPGEIESRLATHPAIEKAVVLAIGRDEDRQLVAWYVSAQEIAAHELQDYLAALLPAYMVPAYFVHLPELPLTANGKLHKRALPLPAIRRDDQYEAPSNDIEHQLVSLWADVLKLDKKVIGVNNNFFALGGHSLRATVLVNRIARAFDIAVPLKEVFSHPTIKGLAAFIRSAAADHFISIQPAAAQEYYPLSGAQRRMYFLYDLDRASLAYNMPQVMRLAGDIDKEKLSHTFQLLVQRHESLRTSFELVQGEPVQKIHPSLTLPVESMNAGNEPPARLIDRFIRPFVLEQAPLLRVGFAALPSGECLLLTDMHHIISDGVSQEILIRDFAALYNDAHLPVLPLQYKDYAVWQQGKGRELAMAVQKAFWMNQFADRPVVLDLPTDFPRPPVQHHAGAHFSFAFSIAETARLKQLAASEGCTLFMVLLAAYNILLAKLSNQEDIVVGTPVAGRHHADLESMVGMFVNTLPLRNYPLGTRTCRAFLQQVKEATLQCFGHQAFPYEELVEALQVERDLSRNPLFDVLFSCQHFEEESSGIPGLNVEPYTSEGRAVAKFDLSLTAVENGEQIYCTLTYATSLFKEETIQRFVDYFRKIVTAITYDLKIPIAGIEVLDDAEKHMLFHVFNNTGTPYPNDKTLTTLFAQQVVATPDHTALVYFDQQLTYHHLDEQANQLANYLRTRGVQPRDLVVLLAERSVQMIVGLLGILKAGATYLPIDTAQPVARVQQVLFVSEARYLLTTAAEPAFSNVEVIRLDDRAIGQYSKAACLIPADPASIAYTVFTSGSTGIPKGVQVKHQGVVNLIHSQRAAFGITPADRILQFSSIGFDASVEQIWLALLSGAALVLVSKEVLLDKLLFDDYIAKQQVTHLHATPSYLEGVLLQSAHMLKRIIAGGEKCKPELAKRLAAIATFYNEYGPTETTVTSTMWTAPQPYQSGGEVPIGRPLGNTTAYILGRNRELLPPGVAGELYIGGDGLAAGYLNDPLQTEERFVELAWLPGERLYRTGDLCRWLPDGNLLFLGRADEQVKIRGFRIEPGEIENRLMMHQSVQQAVVLAVGQDADQFLAVWYVADHALDEGELERYLAASLPDYMVPVAYIHLKELPLTANGKVNRAALLKLPVARQVVYTAPSNALEEKLAGIWSVVLQQDAAAISVDRSFFELGGHSLKATSLAFHIRRELGVALPVIEIFKSPTIRALAASIARLQAPPIPVTEGMTLLNQGGGQQSPLFFVHDGSGDVQGYISLSGTLAAYDVWGIPCDKEARGPVNEQLSKVAARYISRLKKIQPIGPYRLTGWSLGGKIAYEMAFQLEQAGETLQSLVLIDTDLSTIVPWALSVPEDMFMVRDEKKLVYHFLGRKAPLLDRVETIEVLWDTVIEHIEQDAQRLATIRDMVPDDIRYLIPHLDDLSAEQLIRYTNRIRTLKRLGGQAVSGQVKATITYIRASESTGIAEPYYPFFGKQFCSVTLSGNHFSILEPPVVEELGEVIRRSLK